jgi:hypothetical protein
MESVSASFGYINNSGNITFYTHYNDGTGAMSEITLSIKEVTLLGNITLWENSTTTTSGTLYKTVENGDGRYFSVQAVADIGGNTYLINDTIFNFKNSGDVADLVDSALTTVVIVGTMFLLGASINGEASIIMGVIGFGLASLLNLTDIGWGLIVTLGLVGFIIIGVLNRGR